MSGRTFRERRGTARVVVLSVVLLAGQPFAAALAQPAARTAMSPAETAFVAAASRRIEDHFVSEVARITGTTTGQVREAMPEEHRITSTASRLISALELQRGAPLSPEQHAEILEADRLRKQAHTQAREAAREAARGR